MSASFGTSSTTTSSTVRQALATHAVPCLVSAACAAVVTWQLSRRLSRRRVLARPIAPVATLAAATVASSVEESTNAVLQSVPTVDSETLLAEADASTSAKYGMTPRQFNVAAHDLVDQVTRYRATLRERPVRSTVEPGYLRKLVPNSPPEQGEDWSAIEADIERVIMPGITHWASPRFMAYFPAYASYPSLLGEFLCSTLNTIGFSWIGSPASTELETLCLDWIGQMCQLPKEFLHSSELGGGGCIQGTAAEAGAVALLAARQKALDGLSHEEAEARSSKLVAYISDQTHGIIAKGCKITGIDSSRLRVLPTTEKEKFSLQLATVQAAIEADVAKGLVPFFVCLTIGTTSSTAIDAVQPIASWLAQKYPNVYIHIDAAYAGSFAILPSHRKLFNGVELADSFSFNPHKSLLVAFDCTLLYVRARRFLLTALSLANDGEYLRNAATESGKVLDLKDWQLPFGRRFRSLKLWFTIRSYGQEGLRAHLQTAIANAEHLKNHIRTSVRFKLACEPLRFGLVCFVLMPPFAARYTQAQTNALNEELKEAVNQTGKLFFITTMLAGKTILRLACNGESQMGIADCDHAWAVIEEQADRIWLRNRWAQVTMKEVNEGKTTSIISEPDFAAASVSSTVAASASSSSAVTAATAVSSVPVIDISPLRDTTGSPAALAGRARVAREIFQACTSVGFFYVSHHGVSRELQAKLESVSRQFFRLPESEKAKISMKRGGIAWRGWFPCGDELTSGKPDQKEGLYLGTELGPDHPMVKRGVPMHGANLFPDDSLPELRPIVLEWIDEMTKLAHLLMEAIAAALGIDEQYFFKHLTHDPTVLFRIFNYPEQKGAARTADTWGVGEHTDYGLLTLLKQDDSGGLQVRAPNGAWIDAPPIENTFVCNIGDWLDRLTGGLFKSTPHRVRNLAPKDRMSWPLFFDPAWDAEAHPIPLPSHLPKPYISADQQARWDNADLNTLTGTYGDYLLRKVGKVFPQLQAAVLKQ